MRTAAESPSLSRYKALSPADKVKWMAARSPAPSEPQPPAPRTLRRAVTSPIHATGPVRFVAGRALFARAKQAPPLLPLAFLVQALASAASRFSVAAEPLERLLLASSPSQEDLDKIAAAVEALVAAAAAAPTSAYITGDDVEVHLGRLRSIVGRMQIGQAAESPGGLEAAAELEALLQGKAPPAKAAKELSSDSPAEAQPSKPGSEVNKQNELLEMQNKVLIEQVEMMQKMVAQQQQTMAQQQMSMQAFMTRFPQAVDEPERRLVLLKKELMTRPREAFTKVDDVLVNLLISGGLGPHCRAILLNVNGETTSRMLSMCMAGEDGEIVTPNDVPKMMMEQRTSRKVAACQYVVASGEYKCYTKQGTPEGTTCIWLDFMRSSLADLKKDEMVQSLIKADPEFASTWSKTQLMFRKQEDVEAMSMVGRTANNLMSGALNIIPGKTGVLIQTMSQCFAADDAAYSGAPVRCEGRTMGAICGMFIGCPPPA